jgi:DNA invertase Pin-like site-specific DNA recombinase
VISANRRLLRCRVEIIPPSGRRVFGYCRVSTEHQVEDGISLEEQQRRLQGHAIAEDWNFTRIFVEEGISGVIPFGERPQGRQLLTMLRPGDTIVCTALDRFTRSAIDAQRMVRAFRDRQIALWLLDTGGNVTHGRIAKLLLDILAAIAQYQRRQIIARTSGARRYLREHGRFLGGRRPFGYQLDPGKGAVPLRPDPAEQAALEDIRKMRVEGASLRQIAAAMRGHGLELSHVSVKRLLDRADPVPPQLATAIDPDIAA